jgi:hypothetical protein
LFRELPEYAYTSAEQLERCQIADLRRELTEPLVAAGVSRELVLERSQPEENFRRLVAEHFNSKAVSTALADLFERAGRLGDIRKLALHRFDPAQQARARAVETSTHFRELLARGDLIAERTAAGTAREVGAWVDLRVSGPVQTDTGTVNRAAEVRIYLGASYWVDCFREDEDVAGRLTSALGRYFTEGEASPAPSGRGR